MYEDFHVADRWTGEDLHCTWKATMVAIATRHADAVDVRFDVNGRPMWIALPCTAWVAQKQRSGKVITDQLAAQVAGRYLKQLVEEGYDTQREVYTMTVDEVLSKALAGPLTPIDWPDEDEAAATPITVDDTDADAMITH